METFKWKTYNELTLNEQLKLKYNPYFFTTKKCKGIIYYQVLS